MNETDEIPPMTDPLGAHWKQPAREEILTDGKNAVMTKATFAKLAEYSATVPSGVYPGKLWKRHDGAFDPRCEPSARRWLLVWFGVHSLPDRCSINWREILIVS